MVVARDSLALWCTDRKIGEIILGQFDGVCLVVLGQHNVNDVKAELICSMPCNQL